MTALRTAVVGGGLIAQAVHLPNLASMPDRFRIGAIADPSAVVREALARRYAPAVTYADWRDLLDREQLDAVVVCSPHATHAAIALEALGRGLSVFIEKPLCIAPDDAMAICEEAQRSGRVVQVGYMKRFASAYRAWIERLPADPSNLRMIDVVTYDPWMAREPFVRQSEIVGAGDVPAAVRAAAEEDERAQVAAAVGRDDPETVRAFSYTFLACLVHDVNLVHGALDTLGIGNAEAVASTAWADGDAAEATVELPGGAIWRSAWLLLRGLATFQERARLYFVDGIHELEFGVPYHRDASAHHRVTTGQSTAGDTQTRSFVDDPYMAELVHFHDCVTTGLPCMTPPEQGMADIALLRDLFLRRRSLDVHVPLDNAEI